MVGVLGKHAIVTLLAIALFSRSLRADDAPVERPSVARPAAASPAPEQPVAEPQARSHAPAAPTRATQRSERSRPAPRANGAGRERGFPFFALGGGILSGLSGGNEYERTRPAFSAGFGVELPLGLRTGIGFELLGELEATRPRDFSRYRALLARARVSYLLTPQTRLWGAFGLGLAGYEQTAFAPTLAIGTSLLFTREFALDLSGSLTFPGRTDTVYDAPPARPYDGGAVLLFAVRFVYEARR